MTIRRSRIKKLYYNPIEAPNEIHGVSSAFGVDTTYHTWDVGDKPTVFDGLFSLAKLDCLGKIEGK
jgi:hypothetical protein